jgi:hypothetical protein
MAKHDWKPRPPSGPTTIHEICRRYMATATTLAKIMGVPWSEAFLKEHRESIACCFIESGRAGVRLPAGVQLPKLVEAPVAQGTERITSNNGSDGCQPGTFPNDTVEPDVPEVTPPPATCAIVEHLAPAHGDAPPTIIPETLPCGGKGIAELRPAQLALLLAKVDRLAAEKGRPWLPLLEALTQERARRIRNGQRPQPAPGEGDGHGA